MWEAEKWATNALDMRIEKTTHVTAFRLLPRELC